MNLSKNYSFSERERIKIFNPENKDKFKYIDAFRNSFNILETNIYEKLLDSQKTIFLTSETCSFIPIMLSVNLQTNQLSVEQSSAIITKTNIFKIIHNLSEKGFLLIEEKTYSMYSIKYAKYVRL